MNSNQEMIYTTSDRLDKSFSTFAWFVSRTIGVEHSLICICAGRIKEEIYFKESGDVEVFITDERLTKKRAEEVLSMLNEGKSIKIEILPDRSPF